MKLLLILLLLSSCSTTNEARLLEILGVHEQGGYFTANEYLDYLESRE